MTYYGDSLTVTQKNKAAGWLPRFCYFKKISFIPFNMI